MQVMEPILDEKQVCYHCGEPCNNSPIKSNDKVFCCYGCQTVFDILQENDLCTYYDLEDAPGNQVLSIQEDKFDFLDNEEIAQKLLDFNSPSRQKITFSIPSIHCSSCIWLLENLSDIAEGVVSSVIHFGNKKLTVDFDPQKITLKKLALILTRLGYEPLFTLQTIDKKEKKSGKHLYLKIGVAGFSFGNIMLFSFPEYLGLQVEHNLSEFFTYLSMVLAIPVLVYSASDYLKSAYKAVTGGFVNIDVPIALGIITLFVRSSYEVLWQVGPGYFDSLAGLLFFLLIGKWVQSKTYEGLSFDRDYRSYFPLAVQKLVKGVPVITPVYHLDTGDHLRIRHQEIVPADAILMSKAADIDYSFVTGEATPIPLKEGDKIFAGGKLIGQTAEFAVLKPVSQSYLTQLWNDSPDEHLSEGKEQSLIDSISRYFTWAILLLAVVSGGVWAFYDLHQAFLVFTAVLIVACPCALALATPFTLGATMNVLGKNQFYLKHTRVIEKIWKVAHIIFDKTGTITTTHTQGVSYRGKALSTAEREALAAVAGSSVHPYSQAVFDFLKVKKTTNSLSHFEEVTNKGIMGIYRGMEVKLGSSGFVGNEETGNETEGAVYVSIDGMAKGCFEIHNAFRQSLKSMVEDLCQRYSLSIVSGDNERDRKALEEIFPIGTTMLFHQKPDDKVKYVDKVQGDVRQAMMLGDGLNDAVALQKSQVGIAVTDNMSAFTPASDAIIHGNSLTHLGVFLRLIGTSKKVIIACFVISFLYNLVGLTFAVSGNLTPVFAAILMPLSSVTVVGFSTLAIRWIAKSLKLA